LEEFLKKNDYQFLKEVCGEIPENKRDKVFSEILSELDKEKSEIKNSKDFKNIKKNEIKAYVKEVFVNVKKRLDEIDK
jgi:hypothetical protein